MPTAFGTVDRNLKEKRSKLLTNQPTVNTWTFRCTLLSRRHQRDKTQHVSLAKGGVLLQCFLLAVNLLEFPMSRLTWLCMVRYETVLLAGSWMLVQWLYRVEVCTFQLYVPPQLDMLLDWRISIAVMVYKKPPYTHVKRVSSYLLLIPSSFLSF